MSKERLRELLAELGTELNEASDVDDETRELLSQLHDDIDRLTGEEHAGAVLGDHAGHGRSRHRQGRGQIEATGPGAALVVV